MTNPSITFVSAFIDIHSTVKSVEHRMRLFRHLADSGISIHLFLSPSFSDQYTAIIGKRTNVVVEFIELDDLKTFHEIDGLTYKVPASDNPQKDTAAYHIVQNAKIEFVERVRLLEKTTHYAWIDFNICQMFSDVPECMDYLRTKLRALHGLRMPGCWPKNTGHTDFFSRIHWRFCGSFFIGDAESIRNMYDVYRREFKRIVKTHGILTWEVNIWHYLDAHNLWNPIWYSADHNDSIIRP
jgi:hypothetical protein